MEAEPDASTWGGSEGHARLRRMLLSVFEAEATWAVAAGEDSVPSRFRLPLGNKGGSYAGALNFDSKSHPLYPNI